MNGIPWSEEELNIFKEKYPFITNKKLAELLPKRSVTSLKSMAEWLKIRKQVDSRESVLPDLTEIQKAYLAGLFDGEGCVAIQSPRKNKQHALWVTISNTHMGVMEYLRSLFVGKIVHCHKIYKGRKRPCYFFCVTNRKASGFLKLIYPYLIIKKEQVEVALEFQKEISYTNKVITDEMTNRRQFFKIQLQKMKKAHIKN